MSDSDDQAAKKKQKIKDDQSAGCSKMYNMHACLLYETQSTDSNQSTQRTQEILDNIIIETHNDQNTSNLRHIVPVRVDTKAAERSRLYRKRHREAINQRRKILRLRQQILHQLRTVSNVQEKDEFTQMTQETSNNYLSSNSHARRQRRYYERHKEEIKNKRKRDSRLKRNISQSIPATAAERNRNYRERNRQEINERRRDSRLRQQKLQRIHTEFNMNNIDAIEQITKATTNAQQSLNSSNDDVIQEIAHNFTSAPHQRNTKHFEETQNDTKWFKTTKAALRITEDMGDCAVLGCKEKLKNKRRRFFGFPSREQRCWQWLEAIGRTDLKNRDVNVLNSSYFVCDLHFPYSNLTKNVSEDAIPTLHLPPKLDSIDIPPEKYTQTEIRLACSSCTSLICTQCGMPNPCKSQLNTISQNNVHKKFKVEKKNEAKCFDMPASLSDRINIGRRHSMT